MSTERNIKPRHLPGFSLGMNCPEPFDLATDAEARAAWATHLDALAATSDLAEIERSATVAVLGSDRFGAFMAALEAHETVWLAIRDAKVLTERGSGATSDVYDEHDVLVIRFDREHAHPADVIEPGDLTYCNFGYTDSINQLAESALEFCDYFYWATETGLIGFRIEVVYPLGFGQSADERARAGIDVNARVVLSG